VRRLPLASLRCLALISSSLETSHDCDFICIRVLGDVMHSTFIDRGKLEAAVDGYIDSNIRDIEGRRLPPMVGLDTVKYIILPAARRVIWIGHSIMILVWSLQIQSGRGRNTRNDVVMW
jgi:hypothetical protein